tara:strand:- start:4915 stop:5133 length:219 start_codon:yes stop_codon:yes gene_type:complete
VSISNYYRIASIENATVTNAGDNWMHVETAVKLGDTHNPPRKNGMFGNQIKYVFYNPEHWELISSAGDYEVW